ncbi:MAG TPA: hypothetical protein PLH92_17020 [Mycobacterium sp.]|nr:hypothetical protein [Mycobacterium sp.]
MTSINDGQPMWSITDQLLGDLWTLQVRVNSEKGSLADDFDHPARAEITAKAKAAAKTSLKSLFLMRKREQSEKG